MMGGRLMVWCWTRRGSREEKVGEILRFEDLQKKIRRLTETVAQSVSARTPDLLSFYQAGKGPQGQIREGDFDHASMFLPFSFRYSNLTPNTETTSPSLRSFWPRIGALFTNKGFLLLSEMSSM